MSRTRGGGLKSGLPPATILTHTFTMKEAYDYILCISFTLCILCRIWPENKFLDVVTNVACVAFLVSIPLLVYSSWRKTRSMKQALKANGCDLVILAGCLIFMAITWAVAF